MQNIRYSMYEIFSTCSISYHKYSVDITKYEYINIFMYIYVHIVMDMYIDIYTHVYTYTQSDKEIAQHHLYEHI